MALTLDKPCLTSMLCRLAICTVRSFGNESRLLTVRWSCGVSMASPRSRSVRPRRPIATYATNVPERSGSNVTCSTGVTQTLSGFAAIIVGCCPVHSVEATKASQPSVRADTFVVLAVRGPIAAQLVTRSTSVLRTSCSRTACDTPSVLNAMPQHASSVADGSADKDTGASGADVGSQHRLSYAWTSTSVTSAPRPSPSTIGTAIAVAWSLSQPLTVRSLHSCELGWRHTI